MERWDTEEFNMLWGHAQRENWCARKLLIRKEKIDFTVWTFNTRAPGVSGVLSNVYVMFMLSGLYAQVFYWRHIIYSGRFLIHWFKSLGHKMPKEVKKIHTSQSATWRLNENKMQLIHQSK